jgi:hypothetical protein
LRFGSSAVFNKSNLQIAPLHWSKGKKISKKPLNIKPAFHRFFFLIHSLKKPAVFLRCFEILRWGLLGLFMSYGQLKDEQTRQSRANLWHIKKRVPKLKSMEIVINGRKNAILQVFDTP